MIEPHNPIVIAGQFFLLSCKLPNLPIQSCWWFNSNNQLVEASSSSNLAGGDCKIELQATQNDSGLWTCIVWTLTGKESVGTNLTILESPSLTLIPNEDFVTAFADATTIIHCIMNDQPSNPQSLMQRDVFTWKIGAYYISEN